MRAPSYATLDDALELLAPYGIALTNGNSNHAPMVAEALCALGRPDAVMPWLVLNRWVGRLAPGFCAAATHGVIRVGHAARSLAEGETPPRLRELADALASWAATYQELSTSDRETNGAMAPRQAIARVPIVPLDRRNEGGNITASLAMLGDFPEFALSIGLLDTEGDLALLVAELTEVFARIYLANARDIRTTIAFIHGVTSPAALGNMAPQVSDRTARAAARYAWQAGCGLYSCFGQDTATAVNIEPSGADADELVDRAIAHGDEHVIKFTEACLHRHALSPSPVYFAAADYVSSIIPPR